ncbi:uncharacterized protein LOC143570850 [Bidens hawaiensis]|uniref:uncharacterized protein LOC143570850 n=1 Tax=Bidens hawaiensis TaxID=980011 RepID=UPI00404A17BC
MPARRIKAHVDTLLVANQVKGEYEAKVAKMIQYLKKTKELLQNFDKAEFIHISRSLNKKVDSLSKLASVAFDHLVKNVKVETIKHPSILEEMVAGVEAPEPCWMTPILRYLKEGIVPEDREEARRLRILAL